MFGLTRSAFCSGNAFGVALSLMASLLLSACLGGGGDGDVAVSDDPVPPLPSHVQYTAGGPFGDPSTTGLRLIMDEATTIHSTFHLQGGYTPLTKRFSLSRGFVNMLAEDLDFVLPIALAEGDFHIEVDEALQWTFGEHPDNGVFRVIAGNSIRIEINGDIDGQGTAGVDLVLVEFGITTASASLGWPEFADALYDGAAPTYQRQASLAYQVLQRIYEPLQGVIEHFITLSQQESALESAGSGAEIPIPVCAVRDATTGVLGFTWLDGPGEIANALGPGDDFRVRYDNCWLDDPSTPRDLLYAAGNEQLLGYQESTTPFRLGFDEIVITELLITRTEENNGVIATGSQTSFNTFSSVADRDGFLLELVPDVSGTINLVNLNDVARAAAAITLPSEVGNFALDLLDAALSSGTLQDTVPCANGGDYDYVLSSLVFAAGETMQVTFNQCDQGAPADPVVINGSYLLTANSYSGIDDLSFTLALDNVSTQDDVGTSLIDGWMQFARTVSGGTTSNEVSTSVNGQALSISESGATAALSDFSISGTRTTSGLSLGAAGETFVLQIDSITGPLSGLFESAFSGPESTDLQTGSLLVTADDGSNMRLSITDAAGTTVLELDSDGNGSVEDTVTTSWDELN